MQIVVVMVNKLNLHSAPGGRDTEMDEIARKGDRFRVLDRHAGVQADWLKVATIPHGKEYWLAERDKRTGAVFAEVIEAAEPKVIAVTERPWLWPLVVLGIGVTVIALSWSLS